MAVVKELYMQRADGVTLYRYYSDNDFFLLREDGEKFGDAVEPEGSAHTFIESEEKMLTEEELLKLKEKNGSEEPQNRF